jgi:ATP-dependent Clp protease, protease subunit
MKLKRFKNEKYNSLPPIEKVFKAEANDDGTATITIYGDIGESWWGDSISATDVEKVLKNISSNEIHVHINSYGGDVFDGIAIYNQLRNHSAKVIIHVDGVAASAASIIAMSGDEVVMNIGSMLMIHEASSFAWGNKSEIRKVLNALEGIDKSIIDIYMTRYQGDKSEIETMLQHETWFTSSEAVEIGLADKVNETVTEQEDHVDPEEYKNSILEKFRNRKKQSTPIAASANNSILNKFKRQE